MGPLNKNVTNLGRQQLLLSTSVLMKNYFLTIGARHDVGFESAWEITFLRRICHNKESLS
jgi:hypothetical protein